MKYKNPLLQQSLAIPFETPEGETGTEYVPYSQIVIIREYNTEDGDGIMYDIHLTNGTRFNLTATFTESWQIDSNLAIWQQLHPEEC